MEVMQQHDNPFQNQAMLGVKGAEDLLQITRYSGKLYDTPHKTQMDELATTNEEIRKARECLVQSWLDSKPLIDQLERLQLDHNRAKGRASMATVVIPELETQLETIQASIKTTREKEAEARTKSDKLSGSLEQIRGEMEGLKLESDKDRRARAKLKQELRLRRQTLRAMQLAIRAVRIDSDAVEASTASALQQINQSNADDEVNVQLPHEEYHALTRRAQEEKELAEWRISVSMEQRDMAEASRAAALRRLKDIYTGNSSKGEITEVREQDTNHEEEQFKRTPEAFTVPANVRGSKQHFRMSRTNSKKKIVKKKKPSLLHQIKSFLVRNITRFFG